MQLASAHSGDMTIKEGQVRGMVPIKFLSLVFPMNSHRGHASIVLALSASPGPQPEPESASLINNVLPSFCSKYITP